ncbi:glutamine amidotransferase [Gemmatimonas phototrophica]|uniref:Imidazole glycerol phosphate synthase subunit HisH n=2 Tax=Gemmatimonas phototrophica TaxID=1379270 RepID=A0A143BPA7_9BACT|nr:glutamine amidotransferase [Gemmatimonas phototrophica]
MNSVASALPLRVSIFDYGAGNLHSLIKAIEAGGASVTVNVDPVAAVANTDALILPGVGAFAPAAERLAPGLIAMRTALLGGLPALGICLGMQLLFDASDEGPGSGLGIVPGRVTRLAAERVPQIGWNHLDEVHDPLLQAAALNVAYYANSFVCRPTSDGAPFVTAWSEHEGDRFAAAVRRGNVVGTQFHPEKSSAPGVAFVKGFLDFASSVATHNRSSV